MADKMKQESRPHGKIRTIISRCMQKKRLEENLLETPLKRCLTLWDLIMLGIGIMVGPALYVITGTVIRNEAGAGTPFSFLIAGVVALLSSLCYAEFGARVPKAGSAYTYTYVSIGEIWAFLIGWNIILEYIVGTAAAARAFGASVNSLTNGTVRNFMFSKGIYLNIKGFEIYPDFIALGITFLVMIFVISGAKMSTSINNVLSLFNVIILVVIMILCYYTGNIKYWSHSKYGGFAPFGIAGVVSGAGTCFYGYIGFDCIAIAGEETNNPSKTIPNALIITITFVALLNVFVSASLTLVMPYWEINPSAPFTALFENHGILWAVTIVGIGAILGTVTSVIGDLFALPRTVYAMAADGLLFDFLGNINATTQTPIWAIIIFGLLSGLLALILDVSTLVEFLSIGTLLGFTFVAASIIILRYRPLCDMQPALRPDFKTSISKCPTKSAKVASKESELLLIGTLKPKFSKLILLQECKPGKTVNVLTWVITSCMVVLAGSLSFGTGYGTASIVIKCWLGTISTVCIIACLLVMEMHYQNKAVETFQMPLVPWLPALSMLCNISLMLNLHYFTWIRLAVWILVGLIIYFKRILSTCDEQAVITKSDITPQYGSTSTRSPEAKATN